MPVLLVHSPLLGPASWAAVADLTSGAVVPDLRPALVPPYYRSLSEAACAGLDLESGIVLVGHSRAGPLLPAIAARLGSAVRSVVLVDARLPHPGRSWLSTLDDEQAVQVRSLVEGDRVRSWDRWFPGDVLAELVPDSRLRERLRSQLPQVPWGLLTEPAPADDLPSVPVRYVQLSAAYAGPAGQAAALGYEVVRADADHLALMTRPDLVTRRCFGTAGHGE